MSEQLKQKCPVCSAYLFSDDDIVYCPECGTPHHRDCWEALGHCAKASEHEKMKEAEKEQSNDGKTDAENGAEKGEDFSDSICPKCSREIPNDAKFCPWCGNVSDGDSDESPTPDGQKPENNNDHGSDEDPFKVFSLGAIPAPDPYGGVDKESTIDGVKVKDIAKFVAFNPHKTLPKFKAMSENKHKRFWNWIAFISPYSHAMFRKMNLMLFVYLMLELVAYVFFTPFYYAVMNMGLPENITYTQLVSEIINNSDKYITPFVVISAFIGFAVFFGIRIFAALNQDRLYKNHVISTIKNIRADMESDDDYEFYRKGGVRPMLSMLLFLFSTYFSSIIPPLLIDIMFF